MTVPRSMLAEKLSALLSGDDMREVSPSAIRNFVKQNRDALMEAVMVYAEGKQSDVSRLPFGLIDFVRESNRIEGIDRAPMIREIEATAVSLARSYALRRLFNWIGR